MSLQFHVLPVLQVMLLLAVANGVPVLAKRVLGTRFAWPLDGGRRWCDGQPILGASKTVRGVVLALAGCALAAPLLGLDAGTGALVGAAAMAGDVLSSFTKRRLRLAPSSMAPGLDQVPESLLPFLAVAGRLGLGLPDIAAGVAVFWTGELILSRILYAVGIRDRPY